MGPAQYCGGAFSNKNAPPHLFYFLMIFLETVYPFPAVTRTT